MSVSRPMISTHYLSANPKGTSVQTRGLHALVLAAVAAPLIGVVVRPGPVPGWTRLAAAGLWAACLWPVWAELRLPHVRRVPVPFLPLIGIVYGMQFVLPIAFGQFNLGYSTQLNPAADLAPAVLAAALGWAALLGAFATTRHVALRPLFRSPPLRVRDLRKVSLGLLAIGVALRAVSSAVFVPLALSAVLRHFLAVGLLGLVLLVMLWAAGALTGGYRFGTILGAIVLVAFEVVTGSVANVVVVLAMALLGWWAVRRRLSRIGGGVLLALLLVIVVLKGITADYRLIVWNDDTRFSVMERLSVTGHVLGHRLDELGTGALLSEGGQTTWTRLTQSDLLADVIRRTPADVPFWKGETYVSLVGAFVPRVLWPDKPKKVLGQTFGHRYGYLGSADLTTSHNLPWLVEHYANFGWWGIALGGFIVGLIYRLLYGLVNRAGQPALLTGIGIVLLVPLLNIGSDFSLTFGGLPLQLAAFWITLQAVFLLAGHTNFTLRSRRKVPRSNASATYV